HRLTEPMRGRGAHATVSRARHLVLPTWQTYVACRCGYASTQAAHIVRLHQPIRLIGRVIVESKTLVSPGRRAVAFIAADIGIDPFQPLGTAVRRSICEDAGGL